MSGLVWFGMPLTPRHCNYQTQQAIQCDIRYSVEDSISATGPRSSF